MRKPRPQPVVIDRYTETDARGRVWQVNVIEPLRIRDRRMSYLKSKKGYQQS